jgi:isorenieratene synthase
VSERVVIVGGGIGGVAAATLLAEQGAAVTLLEKGKNLGGRAGGWTDLLRDGTLFEMERGTLRFCRFDRNARALLRRVDPSLSSLAPLDDYPLLGPDTAIGSITKLRAADLLRRASAGRVRDLIKSDLRRASLLLSFDPEDTYRRLDATPARTFLNELRFPPAASAVIQALVGHAAFDAFDRYSAAEMVSLFQYCLGADAAGLELDVLRGPASTRVWQPLADYLSDRGARVATRCEVLSVERMNGLVVRYRSRGVLQTVGADALILAADIPSLRTLVATSPDLAVAAPGLRSLEISLPTVTWRVWLDRPVRPERAPFAVTTGLGMLDAIAVHDRLSVPGSRWERERGRCVVELHAYAVAESAGDAAIRGNLLAQLHRLYPETRAARIVEERFLKKRDSPAFLPGTQASRPGVLTSDPRIFLAGDFVKLPFPASPIERAASAGFLAANSILAGWGKRTEPLAHGHVRGALASLRRAKQDLFGL